ncbi:pRL2-19 [Streptomyces sp. NBC_00989]|uniref:pRL2-19 n=1 Tax=Streptomyces sp. NBC_00989 TaxID=2903705 RepID=UPI00386D7E26|nr:pRL2-19 [Streptomyces sp. NBC_00989]
MSESVSGSIGPQDLSHAMLIAVLMSQGGSVTLPPGSFAPDALGGLDGSWHAVAMEPQPNGTVRLSVRPRPDVDGSGLRGE